MPSNYGTAKEITTAKSELDRLQSLENDPYRFGSIQDKVGFRKRRQALEKKVESITPPPVTSDAERKVLEHRRDVLESFIKGKYKDMPGIQSKIERWENPTGAVGKFRRHQNKMHNYTVDLAGNVVPAKRGAGAVQEWKNIQSRLHTLDEQMMDPDVRNIDRLCSNSASGIGLADRKRMNFSQGQNVTEERWEEVFGEPEKVAPASSDAPEPIVASAPVTPKKTREKKPMTEEDQCIEARNDGTRCSGRKMRGKNYCIGHSRRHRKAEAQ